MKIFQHGSISLKKTLAPFPACVQRSFTTLATVLLIVISGTAAADDTDLFTGLNNTPKVLFVLDVSDGETITLLYSLLYTRALGCTPLSYLFAFRVESKLA